MEPALKQLLGEKTALSASMVTNLKKKWEDEFAVWKTEKITERFVYLWADGINLRIRLGEDKNLCVLVIIGVNEHGEKKLLAIEPGYRESKDSWLAVMRDLNERGLTSPALAIGDGALGFWAALREAKGFEQAKEQRCWVHKIVNVLDVLPKRLQARAKALLHEMMYAESKASAVIARKKFADELHAKYPKSVERLEKDWEVLTAFYDFPAAHWQHLRTTNPIESTFATARLRTSITKGAGSKTAAQAMAFKLLTEAEKRWKKICGVNEIKNIFEGVAYKDGVVITTASATNQEVTAA